MMKKAYPGVKATGMQPRSATQHDSWANPRGVRNPKHLAKRGKRKGRRM